MAQIIDENGNVSENLEPYLDQIGLDKAGLNYHILSIIGCQSSGKSTLLNHLFNTTFATMNEATGRQQTTKGIHAAFNDRKVLIFDIEGSDSRERGDADALFERKAALFGIALSEVVMVNMWEKDIGRYNASNIPLLRTVFEVNIQLFSSSSEAKCHLLFVIRDSSAPEEIIKSQVRRDLDGIWNSLVLPPAFQNKKFEDFFVFHFFQLPHLRLMPEEFKVASKKLAARFLDPNDPDFFFSEPMTKLIPGDGLGQYIHSVWDAISENKELNLPSQRKTLSSFRCEEFANDALTKFNEGIEKEILPNLVSMPMENFHGVATDLVTKAINDYNDHSSKYLRDIVIEKRGYLKERIGVALSPLYTKNCQLFRTLVSEQFHDYVKELPSQLADTEGWEQKAVNKMDEVSEKLAKFVSDTLIEEYNWPFEADDFKPKLRQFIDQRMEIMTKDLEDAVFERRRGDFCSEVQTELDAAHPEMWANIRALMSREIDAARAEILAILARNVIDRESVQLGNRTANQFQKAAIEQTKSATNFVAQKMSVRFEERFLQGPDGRPREWANEADIPGLFESAREAGLQVCHMFAAMQLREPNTPIPPNDPLTQQLMSAITVQGIEDRFNEAIQKSYISAVQIRESMRVRNNVPLWMWGIIIYYGYQKMSMAAKHPILAIFVVGILAGLYMMYDKGMLNDAISLVKQWLTKAITFIVDFLKKSNQEVPLPPSIKRNEELAQEKEKEDLENIVQTDQMISMKSMPIRQSARADAISARTTIDRSELLAIKERRKSRNVSENSDGK